MARRRRWIPILIVLALLGAAPAFVGLTWWRAHRKLQSVLAVPPDAGMQVWLAEYRRPSMFGEPVDGNGCDHYDRIARELHVSPLIDQVDGILNSAYPVRFPPPADLARLRDEGRVWIDGIFLGLRSTRLRRGAHYLGGADFFDTQKLLLATAEAERQAGRDAEALRLLAAVLATSADSRRGGTSGIVADDLEDERYAAVLWRVALSHHALSPSDLESACRLLDRIEESRPTIFDAVRVHHEARRALLIDGHLKDHRWSPGWRHLWSRTIRGCALADDMDRNTLDILALEARPPWERERAVEEMQNVITEKDEVWTEAHTLPASPRDFHWDAVGRSMRDLIRVATAVAWYETEKGRMPDRLADLVPRYLPRVPVCAASGDPIPYEGGVLTTPPGIQTGFSHDAGAVDWPIRRR